MKKKKKKIVIKRTGSIAAKRLIINTSNGCCDIKAVIILGKCSLGIALKKLCIKFYFSSFK
jgi:hypothetical protein